MILSTPQGQMEVLTAQRPSLSLPSLGVDTFTHRNVKPEDALGVGAVYAAVTLISQVAGTLPMEVFEQVTPTRTERVTGQGMPSLLGRAPNPDMTAEALWSTVMSHLLLRGNAYLAKLTDDVGRISGLYPLPPDTVQVFRDSRGKKVFRVQRSTRDTADYTAEAVLHIPYLSLGDGTLGHSPIAVLRNRMGVALAASETQARVFKQGTMTRGVLKVQRTLSDEAAERLRNDWAAMYSGADNAHRTPVLEAGVEFQPVALSPKDQEFLGMMKFSATEVAGMYQLPPAMLGAEGASLTYANAAQNDLQLLKYGIGPKLAYIEAALRNDPMLFRPDGGQFPRFNVDNMLRSDAKTRGEMYRLARLYDWMNPNEIRDRENLPPRTDENAEMYRDQLNADEGTSDG